MRYDRVCSNIADGSCGRSDFESNNSRGIGSLFLSAIKSLTILSLLLFVLVIMTSSAHAFAGAMPSPDADDDARYQYLFGTDATVWTTKNKPAGYEDKTKALSKMVNVEVPVWRLEKSGSKKAAVRTLSVNEKLADDVKQIFKEIYALPEKFPVDTLIGFRWNTRGEVSGPFLEKVTCMSAHAYGAAIDINFYQNDYYVGGGNDLRDKADPFYITQSVIDIFEKHGWFWGGNYAICSDTMHFQYTGLDMLSYNTGNPFKVFKVKKTLMKDVRIKNVQRRLNKLGFSCGSADGIYGNMTAAAVKAFQKANGMKANGRTSEAFYVALYNQTHDMYDVK